MNFIGITSGKIMGKYSIYRKLLIFFQIGAVVAMVALIPILFTYKIYLAAVIFAFIGFLGFPIHVNIFFNINFTL